MIRNYRNSMMGGFVWAMVALSAMILTVFLLCFFIPDSKNPENAFEALGKNIGNYRR